MASQPLPRARRWARALTVCAATAATALGTLGMANPAAATPAETTFAPGLYLVTFDHRPAATYPGGVPGYDATRPDDGSRVDSGRVAVSRYRALLERRQDDILDAVGELDPLYRYTMVVSGVAVELTSQQVRDLRTTPGVTAVERNTMSHLDDVDLPSFLGLPGPAGAWGQAGSPEDAGQGVVVGVIDSGLWPDNPSFAAPGMPDDGSGAPGLEDFAGSCQGGEAWSADDCNQKVVAARWFVGAFGADNVANAEYLSPRDAQGHGSHVAATAAGNAGVQMTIGGESLGATSGMAPGAAVAAYKACWVAPDPSDDGCASADVLRALDQAVADGVDVVSHPISGPAGGGAALQQAFRNATAAGVVVVTSAGNDGRRGVSPSSPWVTTVAASTYRLFQGAAVLGDGTRLVGANISEQSVPETAAVLGADAVAPDAERSQAALCMPNSLRAAAVAGKVVVCRRGVNARVDKSRAVHQAGGVAMVLLNTDAGSLDADFHAVPTVHLGRNSAERLQRYLRDAGERARIAIDPTEEDDAAVPQVAGFSGRGPGDTAGVLKPDLTAPGVSVLAAVAPVGNAGRDWDVMSGTSMAAAHVSGLAALIRSEHPDWSATAVRSAMMTTAYDTVGARRGAPAQGAGHVDPTHFLDPGLVFDASSTRNASSPRAINSSSIAVSDLVGRTSVRRTVTNVSRRAETYNAAVSGLPGVDVSVVPATFRLEPGESQTFRVRFVAKRGARFDRFVSGHLTWNGSREHTVRIPLAVRAKRLESPVQRRGVGSTGAIRLTGTGGMTGRIPVEVSGLAGAVPDQISLSPGNFDSDSPTDGPTTHRAEFEVGEDAAAARFDVAARSEDDDFDLYVYRDGDLVTSETGLRADEQVTLVDPEPGRYEVYAHLQRSADNAAAGAAFTGWVVDDTDADNLRTPSSVQLNGGERFSIVARWSRLESSQRWFGLVRLGEGEEQEVTPVSVD